MVADIIHVRILATNLKGSRAGFRVLKFEDLEAKLMSKGKICSNNRN